MSGQLISQIATPAPITAEDWESEELVIVATPSVSGVPSYVLTRTVRQTQKLVITAEGQKFWKHTLREQGGPRQIIPSFAPAYPILRAQLATAEHRRAIGAAYWSFQEHPDRARAQYLAAVLADFLDTTPE